jgi:ribosomal protein S18 acetylase RimI-like enzyme
VHTPLQPDALVRGYRLNRSTLFDLRAVYHLERIIFPRDAYPYIDLAVLFMWPGIVNLKVTTPDGTLAGFVSAVRAWQHRDRGWIITLGVAPVHQRRGLGSCLLAAAEARLGRPCIRLTVRDGNTPAITLYRHAGYEVIERKPGYYHDGETGLIMEKRAISSPGTR